MSIRPINQADSAELLALNNEYKDETSLLTPKDWQNLVDHAFYARQFGTGQGFLVAYCSDQPYENANFKWFADRYDRFIYVDRIVVSPSAQGLGVGRALYENLVEIAQSEGYPRITCEVNEIPPNPGSDAFHQKLGFTVVASVALAAKNKTVRYLTREL